MSSRKPNGGPVPIQRLHHYAYRCRDAEETRKFYEDLLGLPMTLLVRADNVPSTGEYCPYVHIFFEMRDGSNLAFFDLGDNEKSEPSPNTPAWVNHLALEVGSGEELLAMKAHLEANGIQVLGVTDHHIIDSIYFFDPNGIRLEFTVRKEVPAGMKPSSGEFHAYGGEARDALRAWNIEKGQRLSPKQGARRAS